MKKLSLYSALLLVLIITAACEHKELCYDHESHIPRTQYAIKLNFDCQWEYNLEDHIDWKQAPPSKAERRYCLNRTPYCHIRSKK